MRSVRLGDELESRLLEISQETGQPVSEIIREAVRVRCSHLLGGQNEARLSYFIGALRSTKAARRRTPLANTAKTVARALNKKSRGRVR